MWLVGVRKVTPSFSMSTSLASTPLSASTTKIPDGPSSITKWVSSISGIDSDDYNHKSFFCFQYFFLLFSYRFPFTFKCFIARVRQPAPSPPPTPRRTAHILLNLRGLVFNFINKKFLLLFLFSVADFFSRTKSFIDIEEED